MERYDLYFKNQYDEKYLFNIDLQELDVFIVLPRNRGYKIVFMRSKFMFLLNIKKDVKLEL